jgi:hypothetical protein
MKGRRHCTALGAAFEPSLVEKRRPRALRPWLCCSAACAGAISAVPLRVNPNCMNSTQGAFRFERSFCLGSRQEGQSQVSRRQLSSIFDAQSGR